MGAVKTPPRSLVVLRTRSQLDVLASPVRLEILELFKGAGAISIADVARKMERAANSITYHVHRLAAAGILVRAGSRRGARREEALYALAGREIAVGINPCSPVALRAASKSASTILRLAEREVRKALTSKDLSASGLSGRPAIRRLRTSLTEESAGELARRLDGVQRWLARCARKKQGRAHAVTIVVVPLLPGRKPR